MGQPRAWVPPQDRAPLHPQSIPPRPRSAGTGSGTTAAGRRGTYLGCRRCRQPPSLAGSPSIPKRRVLPATPPPHPRPLQLGAGSRRPPLALSIAHFGSSGARLPSRKIAGWRGGGGGAAFLFPFPSPPPESPPPPAWKRGCELEKGGTSCREGLFQEKKSERAVLGTDSHVSPYVTYKNCPFLPFLGSRGGGVGGRLRYLCLRRGVKTPLKPHPVKTGFL